jgi:hypothetical protein
MFFGEILVYFERKSVIYVRKVGRRRAIFQYLGSVLAIAHSAIDHGARFSRWLARLERRGRIAAAIATMRRMG